MSAKWIDGSGISYLVNDDGRVIAKVTFPILESIGFKITYQATADKGGSGYYESLGEYIDRDSAKRKCELWCRPRDVRA